MKKSILSLSVLGSTDNFSKVDIISIHTYACAGCSHPSEGGVILQLDGIITTAGTAFCITAPLDHDDMVDYSNGGISDFVEKDLLGGCFEVNMRGWELVQSLLTDRLSEVLGRTKLHKERI